MPDVGDALEGILERPPLPGAGAEVVEFAGGRRALTEALSGMSGPPRAADYGGRGTPEFRAASTRWRSASRRAQRADDEGKEGKQRRGTLRLTEAQRERVQERGAARQLAALYRDGGRMRLECMMRVGTPGVRSRERTRHREIPAGGPGVYLSPASLDDAVHAIDDGDRDAAGMFLLGEFFNEYGIDPDMVEVETVIRLKLWPDGSPEPA